MARSEEPRGQADAADERLLDRGKCVHGGVEGSGGDVDTVFGRGSREAAFGFVFISGREEAAHEHGSHRPAEEITDVLDLETGGGEDRVERGFCVPAEVEVGVIVGGPEGFERGDGEKEETSRGENFVDVHGGGAVV